MTDHAQPRATSRATPDHDKRLLVGLYAWRAAKAIYGFADCVALWFVLYSDFSPWSLWLAGGLLVFSVVVVFWPTPRWVRELRVLAIARRKQRDGRTR